MGKYIIVSKNGHKPLLQPVLTTFVLSHCNPSNYRGRVSPTLWSEPDLVPCPVNMILWTWMLGRRPTLHFKGCMWLVDSVSLPSPSWEHGQVSLVQGDSCLKQADSLQSTAYLICKKFEWTHLKSRVLPRWWQQIGEQYTHCTISQELCGHCDAWLLRS